ncbi:hypothetical protein IMSAGC005_01736 [Lachnospiraceae bacterium]|nr:hypothetical protein IMSAGC005_01736 [Lachnospiraceae bacterium]
MGKGIGCKCCEVAAEKQIEKILKEQEYKIKSMTLAEINKDLENFSAERKARMAELRAARATKEQNT